MIFFLRQAKAFLKRDLLESMSYKVPFTIEFVSRLIHLSIFFFIAKFFGNQANSFLRPYGGQYFPFALVGIVFVTFQTSALRSLAYVISKEQSHGTLEAIMMSPSKLIQLISAAALWDFVFAFFRTVMLLAAAAWIFKVDLSAMNWGAAGVMILLTIISLLGFGLVSAGYLLAFKRGDPVSFILDGVSKLFAGVYFPVQIFPHWVQGFSAWIPFTHALSGLRKAILLGAPVSALSSEISVLMLTALLSLPLGVMFFSRMVDTVRRRGSLSFA